MYAVGDDHTDMQFRDTQSVTESVLNYRVENGRTYHAYKDGGKSQGINSLGFLSPIHVLAQLTINSILPAERPGRDRAIATTSRDLP